MQSKAKKITVGVAQALLTVGIGFPGIMKLVKSYDEMTEMAPWTNDFTPGMVVAIGVIEIIGVIGLNLPLIIKKFQKLVPLAGAGLVLTMVGAVITHLGRGESFLPPLVLMFIGIFVTWSRRNLLKES